MRQMPCLLYASLRVRTPCEECFGALRDLRRASFGGMLRRSADERARTRIRRYLELYGFINHAGTVGVWGFEQFKALGLGAPR